MNHYNFRENNEKNTKIIICQRIEWKLLITRLLKKSILVLILLAFIPISLSSSLFSDIETAASNEMGTGIIDLEMAKKNDAITPEKIVAGAFTSQDIIMRNSGLNTFIYSQEMTEPTGSTDLCNSLELKAYYKYYNELGELKKTLKYTGLLTDFEMGKLADDPDFKIGNNLSYYPNTDYVENEHWYQFDLGLSGNAANSLGNLSCNFKIVGKAWQPNLSYGVGFWDREELDFNIQSDSWAKVSGMKFNDADGDKTKDTDELGLADWTIFATRQLEQFEVLATGEVKTSATLESDKTYLVRVTGTYSAGDGVTVDAKYSVKAPASKWQDIPEGLESYGSDMLDLQIDNVSPIWGAYSDTHTYWTSVEGNNMSLTFSIKDILTDNNNGSLQVTIFEPVRETLTDNDGHYSLDLSGLTGEVVIAEAPKSGWQQTFPAKYFYPISDPTKIYENYDFGNKQVPEPTQSLKIIINEVYYDVADDEGSENNEWIELYNPNDTDINLKDWIIADNNYARTLSLVDKIIPAYGFAVVTRDSTTWPFWPNMPVSAVKIELGLLIGNGLAAGGDRLILKNSASEIVDQISWGSDTTILNPSILLVDEGHSIAREPLGFDSDSNSDWMELEKPNPGTNPHSHIQVNLNQEDNNLLVGFTNAWGFDSVRYKISYNHLLYGLKIPEAIEGEAKKTLNQDILVLPPFYLGTCSSLGISCVSHKQVQDLVIDLLYKNGQEILGTSQVKYEWE